MVSVVGFTQLCIWISSVHAYDIHCSLQWRWNDKCQNLQVVRYNYTAEERKALVELVSYIKSIGSLVQRSDTLVADALWETIHSEVQDFVQNTLATMLRTTFRKKKDLSRWVICNVCKQWCTTDCKDECLNSNVNVVM